MMFVCRWIRLTPLLMIIIFFYSTLFPKIGSGPLWQSTVKPLSNYWRRFLGGLNFFISFWNNLEMCEHSRFWKFQNFNRTKIDRKFDQKSKQIAKIKFLAKIKISTKRKILTKNVFALNVMLNWHFWYKIIDEIKLSARSEI